MPNISPNRKFDSATASKKGFYKPQTFSKLSLQHTRVLQRVTSISLNLLHWILLPSFLVKRNEKLAATQTQIKVTTSNYSSKKHIQHIRIQIHQSTNKNYTFNNLKLPTWKEQPINWGAQTHSSKESPRSPLRNLCYAAFEKTEKKEEDIPQN